MKKIYIAIALILILFLILPFLYLFFPVRIKDYVHRELCYHAIVDKIEADSGDPDDFLKNIVNYVYTNIDSHGHKMPIIDDTSWDCFVRGFGYCDQQVWALSTLLAKKDIPARLVMLHSTLSSDHSVVEAYIDGRWRLIDPNMNAVYYNKKEELATFNDIHNDLVNIEPVLSKENYDTRLYKSYFDPENPPDRWGALTAKQGILRKIVFSPVYFQYKLFGPGFSRFYQNLYLIGKDKFIAERNRYLIGCAAL